MLCPSCKNENTAVIDSRDVDSRSVRRRRKCESCSYRFTTYERIEQIKLQVLKRNGKTEVFDREKVKKGIVISSNNRIDEDKIDEMVDDIEQKLLEFKDNVMPSRKIGNLVIARLKKIDEISYLRFASVYKDFKDIDSFEQELNKLKK